MAHTNGSSPVTRSEFYGAVSTIWLLIMFTLGQLASDNRQWTTIILFAIATLMTLAYALLTVRTMTRQKRGDNPA